MARVALVTGGSRGIGAAVSKALKAQAARLRQAMQAMMKRPSLQGGNRHSRVQVGCVKL